MSNYRTANPTSLPAPETEEEFIARFVKHMVQCAGPNFDDGTSVEDYAREVAPLYFAEIDQRADGPEECADSDMSYWGED